MLPDTALLLDSVGFFETNKEFYANFYYEDGYKFLKSWKLPNSEYVKSWLVDYGILVMTAQRMGRGHYYSIHSLGEDGKTFHNTDKNNQYFETDKLALEHGICRALELIVNKKIAL